MWDLACPPPPSLVYEGCWAAEERTPALRSHKTLRRRAVGRPESLGPAIPVCPIASCAHHARGVWMSELTVVSKEKKQRYANVPSKLHEKSKADKRDFVSIWCHNADHSTEYRLSLPHAVWKEILTKHDMTASLNVSAIHTPQEVTNATLDSEKLHCQASS